MLISSRGCGFRQHEAMTTFVFLLWNLHMNKARRDCTRCSKQRDRKFSTFFIVVFTWGFFLGCCACDSRKASFNVLRPGVLTRRIVNSSRGGTSRGYLHRCRCCASPEERLLRFSWRRWRLLLLPRWRPFLLFHNDEYRP